MGCVRLTLREKKLVVFTLNLIKGIDNKEERKKAYTILKSITGGKKL